ncbi:hypothetical protein PENANT_c117G02749 [Penicillium antarcticum]|uniref:Uncharacterized protein n=1 Tax=Penicillium antarcticum TaxID=416450 RepID=A0A1V6PIG8_9EURO|nr:hypothetical protein PENANT_c117G02749 [Penicillium antarcticum]
MASTQGISFKETQSSALDIIEQTVQRDAIKIEGNAAEDGQYWLLRSIME